MFKNKVLKGSRQSQNKLSEKIKLNTLQRKITKPRH